MTEKVFKMDRTPEFEETRGVAFRLGEHLIETPHGVVRMTDAPGYSTLLLDAGKPEDSAIGFLLYRPAAEKGDVGVGLISQMNATQARTIAASLLRLAAKIDPSKPN